MCGVGGGSVCVVMGLNRLIGGSVDGLYLCVWLCCGWVMVEVAGSSRFPMGFFFFFFLIWVFVQVGFW